MRAAPRAKPSETVYTASTTAFQARLEHARAFKARREAAAAAAEAALTYSPPRRPPISVTIVPLGSRSPGRVMKGRERGGKDGALPWALRAKPASDPIAWLARAQQWLHEHDMPAAPGHDSPRGDPSGLASHVQATGLATPDPAASASAVPDPALLPSHTPLRPRPPDVLLPDCAMPTPAVKLAGLQGGMRVDARPYTANLPTCREPPLRNMCRPSSARMGAQSPTAAQLYASRPQSARIALRAGQPYAAAGVVTPHRGVTPLRPQHGEQRGQRPQSARQQIRLAMI